MYQIVLKESARKELLRIPKVAIGKIAHAIDGLEIEPRPLGVKKLKGSEEDLYRIRVGDYRIIYAISDTIRVVNIRKIGHRKDIYK
jgi:mRNA interferase RelE/StbE